MKSLLKLGIGLALLALILWRLGGVAPIAAAFSLIVPAYVALLIAIALADRVLMAYKWRLLLRAEGVELPFLRVLTVYCVSNFWGQVLPMTVGGDMVRLWLTKRVTGRFETIVASIAIERLIGFVAALLMGLAGLLILGAQVRLESQWSNLWWLGIAVMVAGVAGLGLTLSQSLFDQVYGRMPALITRTGWMQQVRRIHEACLSYRRHGPVLWRFFFLTLIEQLAPIVFLWASAHAFGLPMNLVTAAAVAPLATLITRVPISIAGIGVFEGAYMVLLPLVGVPKALAVSMALLDRVIVVLTTAAWWLGDAITTGSFAMPARSQAGEGRADPSS